MPTTPSSKPKKPAVDLLRAFIGAKTAFEDLRREDAKHQAEQAVRAERVVFAERKLRLALEAKGAKGIISDLRRELAAWKQALLAAVKAAKASSRELTRSRRALARARRLAGPAARYL